MKNLTAFFAIAGVLIMAGAAGDTAAHDQFTKHYSGTTLKVTEEELYSIELIVPGQNLYVGRNNLRMIVHNRQDQDVSGADVSATPYRPGSSEVTGETFQGTDLGEGLYALPVTVPQEGAWALEIRVEKGVQDKAVFEFQDVGLREGAVLEQQVMPEGHTHGGGQGHAHGGRKRIGVVQRPENLDTATTTTSEKGGYKVSYEPEGGSIPVGRIHSWKIRIMDDAGRPVDPAKIVVDGNMPEHGHGLPTQPEVTESLGNGYFLVEGIRFSMPGWWVMEVEIYTAEDFDTAGFNLILP